MQALRTALNHYSTVKLVVTKFKNDLRNKDNSLSALGETWAELLDRPAHVKAQCKSGLCSAGKHHIWFVRNANNRSVYDAKEKVVCSVRWTVANDVLCRVCTERQSH